MTASLGGFLGRKGDGEPGTQTMWLGLQRLDDITMMWQVAIDTIKAPEVILLLLPCPEQVMGKVKSRAGGLPNRN